MNGLHTRHVAAAMVAFCGLAAGVHGQCASPQWVGGEGFPGADGPVNATTLWDPDGAGPLPEVLVAGGDFQVFGSARASRIGTWDGSTFRALGSGMNASVRALTVFNGQLYAAGDFTQAGGQPANRIARWNGSSWEALPGGGTSDPIYALTVHAGDLYAGGIFTEAGIDPAAVAIARWNGSAWSSVGSGATDGPVYTLASYGGELYAGGEFTTLGGSGSPALAKWNGSAWSSVGGGLGFFGVPRVLALHVDGGSLLVGGTFASAGGVTSPSIARWNGTTWSSVGSTFQGGIQFIKRVGGVLYATSVAGAGSGSGSPVLVRLDGSTWNFAGPPARGIEAYAGRAMLGGSFISLAQNFGALVNMEAYPVSSVVTAFNNLAPFGSNLIGVGDFFTVGGVVTRGVASYDGTRWSALGGGIQDTCQDAIAIGSDLYVSCNGGLYRLLGTSWQLVNTPFTSPSHLENLNGQLVVWANGVWRFSPSAGWSQLGGVGLGPATTRGQGLIVVNNQLYAAGVSGSVVRWNGLAWVAVPNSPTGQSLNFASHNGELHVAFNDFVPANVARVYRLDSGGTWTQLGPSFAGSVDRISSANGSLLAGGLFTAVGATPINRLARWDGAAWQSVDGGVDNAVRAIEPYGNQIAVAGTFNSVGGPSDPPLSRFALLGCQTSTACYANCDGSTAAPVLNALDFSCFLGRYVAADPYANCDGSTAAPVLNALDFSCFLGRYVAGCP